MLKSCVVLELRLRRRLHGRRGLKWECHFLINAMNRRRLHGRRGLKLIICLFCFIVIRRRLHGRRGLKSPVIKC